MIQYSEDILTRLLAPRLHDFTTAEIPDLRSRFPQADFWLANHFLNSALGLSFKHPTRQVVLAYLRRAHYGFRAYHDARALTLVYLSVSKPFSPNVKALYDAVTRWEEFALQMSMGMDAFRWLTDDKGAFDKGDSSKELRLYTIANKVKHVTRSVSSGECSESHTVPLWLTNEGLASFGIEVSYAEVAHVLTDVGKLADELQNPAEFARNRSRNSTAR